MLVDDLRRISASPRAAPISLATAVPMFALVVAADSSTSYELSLSSFYLLIILGVGWFCGVSWAALFAVLSVFAQVEIGRLAEYPLSEPLYFYVSQANRLVAYLLVALLISRVRTLYDRETAMARVDHLTGLANNMAFNEQLASEIARHRRDAQSFAVAYIDCDNFKTVNDRFGHAAGDALLKAIARTCRSSLRRSDIVARLGGDEFAVVLPRTGESPAFQVADKLRAQLAAAMVANKWPVTFSIGLASFPRVPESVERVVSFSDELMYRVKKSGKNDLLHRVYGLENAATDAPARLQAG